MELNEGVLTKSNKDGIRRVKEAQGGEDTMAHIKQYGTEGPGLFCLGCSIFV